MRALPLAIALLATVPAAAAPALSESWSSGGPGAQWVAVRFTTAGAPLRLEMYAHDAEEPVVAALALQDADGAGLGRGWTGGFNHRAGAWAGVQGARVEDWGSAGSGLWGISATFNDPSVEGRIVGEHRAVMWVAGAPRAWSARASVSPGASILSVETGPRTFLADGRDFGGAVAGGANALGLGARVNVGGEVDLVAERGFVGFFTPIVTSVDALSVAAPNGTWTCPCFLDAAGPAGAYTFRATGVGGPLYGISDLVLTGADVA